MAVEFCLGNRNTDRHQPDFQRHLQGHAFAGCSARRSGRRLTLSAYYASKVAQKPLIPLRVEDQEKEDHKEQEVNAALQDVRLAAGKGDDADGQGEQEKGKISTLQAERDLAMGDESDGKDGRDS